MKLISLNLWGGRLFKPLMDFILAHANNTDLFCFQEMFDTNSDTSESFGFRLNLYQELSKILPKHKGYFASVLENYIAGSFQPNFVDFNLSWGISIFASKKLNITSSGDFFVFGKKGDFNPKDLNTLPRNTQYVTFINEGKQSTVCNLHGIWVKGTKGDTSSRIKQSQMIKDFLDKQRGAKILCGDLNLDINTQSLKLLEVSMKNLIKEYKIPTTRNKFYERTDDKFADYALVSNDVIVSNFKVPNVEISDHLPLILEFS